MTVRSGPPAADTRCACRAMSGSVLLHRARHYPRLDGSGHSLWRHPCGDILVATSLWRHPCGDILVATSLWRHPCGDILVATSLWRHRCGDIATLGVAAGVFALGAVGAGGWPARHPISVLHGRIDPNMEGPGMWAQLTKMV